MSGINDNVLKVFYFTGKITHTIILLYTHLAFQFIKKHKPTATQMPLNAPVITSSVQT